MTDDKSNIKTHPFCYDIVEVYRTQYEAQVNKRLAAGWKLLDVFTTCYDPEIFYKDQSIHYVLGRPESVAPFEPQQEDSF